MRIKDESIHPFVIEHKEDCFHVGKTYITKDKKGVDQELLTSPKYFSKLKSALQYVAEQKTAESSDTVNLKTYINKYKEVLEDVFSKTYL